MTILVILNEFCIFSDFDYDISENYDSFLILKKLLLDVRDTRKFELVNLDNKFKKKHLKHAIKENCNKIINSKSRCDNNIDKHIDHLSMKSTLIIYK